MIRFRREIARCVALRRSDRDGYGLRGRFGDGREGDSCGGGGPEVEIWVVLRPSGKFAPHFVQVWRESAFAILHFEQNIGTSTLLKREYSRVVSDYAKDSVR